MIYYIADCHLGHKNVIGFDGRPFFTIEEMDKTIIDNWNATVKAGDTVYILGDFIWKGAEEKWIEILDSLTGNKVLIKGNHDIHNFSPVLKKKFADIKDYKEIDDNGRKVILCHFPIMAYKASYNPCVYMVHGHVHITKEADYILKWKKELRENISLPYDNKGNIYNAGCMLPYMNYTPRTLDELIASDFTEAKNKSK